MVCLQMHKQRRLISPQFAFRLFQAILNCCYFAFADLAAAAARLLDDISELPGAAADTGRSLLEKVIALQSMLSDLMDTVQQVRHAVQCF